MRSLRAPDPPPSKKQPNTHDARLTTSSRAARRSQSSHQTPSISLPHRHRHTHSSPKPLINLTHIVEHVPRCGSHPVAYPACLASARTLGVPPRQRGPRSMRCATKVTRLGETHCPPGNNTSHPCLAQPSAPMHPARALTYLPPSRSDRLAL